MIKVHEVRAATAALLLFLAPAAAAQSEPFGGLESSLMVIDEPLTFGVLGTRGQSWWLYGSDTSVSLPLPGIGTLLLDIAPPMPILFGSGLLDAAGRGSTTVYIPNDPALLGFTMFVQGLRTSLAAPSGFSLTRGVRVDFETENAEFTATSSPAGALVASASVALRDGRTLFIGPGLSTSLYDPFTRTVVSGPTMGFAREGSVIAAATLGDGRILIAGGSNNGQGLAATEIFDPSTNTVVSAGAMSTPRVFHTLTPLANGMVLAAGGTSHGFTPFPFNNYAGYYAATLSSAELFDPSTGTWTPTANMGGNRAGHTAERLPNGNVMLIGGFSGGGPGIPQGTLFVTALATTRIFSPASATWSNGVSMSSSRWFHASSSTLAGDIAVTGGLAPTGFTFAETGSAAAYVLALNAWLPLTPLATSMSMHRQFTMRNGNILIAGPSASYVLAIPSLVVTALPFGLQGGTLSADGTVVRSGLVGGPGHSIRVYVPTP